MKFPIEMFPKSTSYDFMRKKKFAFGFSLFTVLLTFILFFTNGFNLGIDFTGGVVIELRTSKAEDLHQFRKVFHEMGYQGTSIQNSNNDKNIIIRFQIQNENNQAKEVETLKEVLATKITPDIEFRKIDYVGPKVGQELIFKGIQAIFIALIGMMLYICFRFNFAFGIAGVISLLHDAIATIGFYLLANVEFDLTSIAAILTVIGYSINDKVVIFDRIRENLGKYKVRKLNVIINQSINETLSRTTMTVLTTLLVCFSLVIFGGEVLRGLSMAMFFGIVFGTYSSIFIAAPLLIYTYKINENSKNKVKTNEL